MLQGHLAFTPTPKKEKYAMNDEWITPEMFELDVEEVLEQMELDVAYATSVPDLNQDHG